MWHIKLTHCTLSEPYMETSSSPAVPLLIQFCAYGLGKQWRWAKSLGPYSHMAALEEALGFWPLLDPAPIVASIWAVKQQMKSFSLFLPLSVSSSSLSVSL